MPSTEWAGSPSRFLAGRAFALAERLGSMNAAAQLGTTGRRRITRAASLAFL
jgi:hypothetical protein